VRWAFPPILGLALFVCAWAVLSHFRTELPNPIATWHSAVELFAHPFYNNGPNDQGIGWNILHSLGVSV
jgi:nitrate/nitrite transport system permease protein